MKVLRIHGEDAEELVEMYLDCGPYARVDTLMCNDYESLYSFRNSKMKVAVIQGEISRLQEATLEGTYELIIAWTVYPTIILGTARVANLTTMVQSEDHEKGVLKGHFVFRGNRNALRQIAGNYYD